MARLTALPNRWLPQAWPAPVLNGLSVGAGLLLLCGLIATVAGVPAAVTASSGAAATSVADTICAPHTKRHQMVPAVLASLVVALLVGLTHAQPLLLGLMSLLVIFVGIGWMAYGKRGGPQTFVAVLGLVFQTAAYLHTPSGSPPTPLGTHLTWVAVGAVGMAVWAQFTAWLMARRYRELALADALGALATLMQRQAKWTEQSALGTHAAPSASPGALLALIHAQATLPDILQSARDLIYSQAPRSAHDARLRETTESLIQAIRLRDVLMGCSLDLEAGPSGLGPRSLEAMHLLADALRSMSWRLHHAALAWRGVPMPGGGTLPPATPGPQLAGSDTAMAGEAAGLAPDVALQASLLRRIQHLAWLVDAIDAQVPARHAPPGGTMPTLIPSPLPPVDVPTQAAVLLGMTTSPRWTLPPLKAQAHWGSPVLRYAARTTLAAACALLLGHLLPWGSHPYWILMTVAVVMRGSLEQTLMRRNARIQGTLLGCLLAAGLAATLPSPLALLLCIGLALSLAHGFVTIDYRITAASGAVLALLQGHLFAPGQHGLWLDAVERVGDTLIGAALAWGFSHVWPAWERQTLPRLVGRLLQSLARDAHHALTAWPPAASSVSTASSASSPPADAAATAPPPRHHLERHLARRDTQETLALLTQALQRMDKEPQRVRSVAPEVERLLVHCHALSSLIAGIRGLLSVKGDHIVPEVALPALTQTHRAIVQAFRDTRPDPDGHTRPGPHAWATPPDPVDAELDLPRGEGELDPSQNATTTTAWLLRRLTQARQVAQEVAEAARPLRALP